jgi:succinyl-diaminopimelate desuccinylase
VYNPEITDGRIYGAGSGDMKGALAIMLELFFNFHRSHPAISLGLAVTSDEEQGGSSGVGYLFDEVGLRCGTAIVPDGGSLNEITIAEKGVIHLHIICLGHSSHAARPWLADNPLEKLLERVASLKRYFLALKHDGDHWYPTCTLTRVETPNLATNRIPSVAKADLDIRFPPPYTVDQMLGELTQVLGSHIEAKVILSSDPMEFQPDALFKKAIEEVTGESVFFIREDGASDSRFIQRYGIPVIISRPIVGELHSGDEWIDIDSMVKFYLICERFLERKLLAKEK